MNLTELGKLAGGHRRRRRVGRGRSSGSGKTCGRGQKGCNARSGGGAGPLSEGGQMAVVRRLPKRGFSNRRFGRRYCPVNVADLEAAFQDGAEVTPEAMRQAGLVRNLRQPVKVLGQGRLAKKLLVQAQRFSRAAAEKIAAAGGQVRVI